LDLRVLICVSVPFRYHRSIPFLALTIAIFSRDGRSR